MTLGKGENNVPACIALNLSKSAKRDQTSRVSGEFLMLTLARTECVGEPVRVNWKRDVKRGVTSSARASVAQAPPSVTLELPMQAVRCERSEAWASAFRACA